MKRFLPFLRKLPDKWFVIGLFAIPFIAWLWPELGAHQTQSQAETINNLCIAFIFLFNGMSIKKTHLAKTFQKIKLHIFIQSFCFLFFPLIALLLNFFVLIPFRLLQDQLTTGIFMMACLPITTSSCVILTKMAKGDDHSSLFNALISNLLGILITPLILSDFFNLEDSTALVKPLTIIGKLSLITFFPMVLGYYIRLNVSADHRYFEERVNIISEILLLYVVYSAFCDTFLRAQNLSSPGLQIGILTLVLAFLHFSILLSGAWLSQMFDFSLSEQKVILFTVPQKTVALGIPLISLVIQTTQNSPSFPEEAGLYFLPLLIYNNIQMLVAGPLAYFASKKK